MPGPDAAETVTVRITVRNARPVSSRTLFALVDADIEVGGIVLSLLGVQARSARTGGTEVAMPHCRREDGSWSPAVALPAEVVQPLTTAVLQFLLEEGLAHNRLLRSFVPRGLHDAGPTRTA